MKHFIGFLQLMIPPNTPSKYMDQEYKAILETLIHLNNLAFKWKKRAEARGFHVRRPKAEEIRITTEFQDFASLATQQDAPS